MKILVLNSGSSSHKSALFELEHDASADPVSPLWEGKLEWDGTRQNRVIRNSQGDEIRDQAESHRQTSVEEMLRDDAAQTSPPPRLAHRVAESIAKEPKPERSWWQRLFSRRSADL